jgi:hypothetical protein
MIKKNYLYPLLLSLITNILILALPSYLNISGEWQSELSKTEKQRPLKIFNIMKSIGKKSGKKGHVLSPKKKTVKTQKKRKKLNTKNLQFNSLQELDLDKFKNKTLTKKVSPSLFKLKKKGSGPALSLNNEKIKNFIKSSPLNSDPLDQLKAFDDTDVFFDLQVPKGVAEDQLNKAELVFYSFRKRTALAYVNSFRKELNSFERKNPHLTFPMTNFEETISGTITYDKNGDILTIQSRKWTQISKLQEFFMDVLKNMSSLPNPPVELISGDEKFVINFVFTVNPNYQ